MSRIGGGDCSAALLRQIAPAWTERAADKYTVAAPDGTPRQTWSLVIDDLPATTGCGSDGWLTPLLRLDGTVRLALHVEPMSARGAAWWLALQESGHKSTAHLRERAGLLADRRVNRAAEEAERVSTEVADGVARLFRVGITVTLEAPTLEALETLKAEAIAYLDRRLLVWRDLHWRHDLAFRGAMPDGARRVWCPRVTNTSTLAYSWPCVGATVSMDTGPLWGIATEDDTPVLYDPRRADLGVPGPHVVCIGPTGVGKTTATASAWSQLLLGDDEAVPDVVLIDPKGDYRRFAVELDGQRVAINTAPDDAMNVCDLPPAPQDARQRRTFNAVDEAVENLTGFVSLACGQQTPLTDEEIARLHKAALRMYAAATPRPIRREDPGTWLAGADRVPILPDLLPALDDAGASALAVRLEPYATGIYSGLFGRRTTLRATQRVVAFDLEDLGERLQPLATYLISAHTWMRARRAPRRAGLVFVMDEIATLLSNPHTARLVGEMYAKGRQFGLSVWSMSQSRADYEQTNEGRRALDNAHTVLEMDAQRRGVGTLSTPRGRVTLAVCPADLVREWLSGNGQKESGPSLVLRSPDGAARRLRVVSVALRRRGRHTRAAIAG